MPDHPVAADLSGDLRRSLAGAPGLATILPVGERIIAAGADAASRPSGTVTQRIAVLGAANTDYLSRAIACAVLQEGVLPILYQAPFGSYAQHVLDPTTPLSGFASELVVLAPQGRDLVVELPIGASAAEVDVALDAGVALFGSLWDRLESQGARIIQHLLIPPSPRYRGIAERLAPASPANQIRRLNERLLQAGRGRVRWIELDAFADQIGLRQFSPARLYHTARLEFDPRWLPDYLPLFRAAWRQAEGRGRKVLVLDLDNTLSGGVIGDDGVDGIVLGPGSPVGEAFAAWQCYLKELAQRGVILAVCSKNAPEIAVTGFSHPGAVLKREDFAAFDCAWTDKPGGLHRIAAALNLGIDSFVFADDNPAECELIRQALPEVAVLHLGTDPSRFADLLDAGHWLDLPAYTGEDLGRSAAYRARAAALAAQAEAPDLAGYLAGLAMQGQLYRPGEADLTRMAQLEQKTNQFNLTTRRHSEAVLRGLLARDDAIVLALRLADRFGDHGLVATLLAVPDGDALRINSWLMSCRVFSRSAEQFMLRGLLDLARERGVPRVLGEYRATAKNAVVAELYPRLGFAAVGVGKFTRTVGAGVADLVSSIAPVEPAQSPNRVAPGEPATPPVRG